MYFEIDAVDIHRESFIHPILWKEQGWIVSKAMNLEQNSQVPGGQRSQDEPESADPRDEPAGQSSHTSASTEKERQT